MAWLLQSVPQAQMIFRLQESVNGTNSSDYLVESENNLEIDALSGVDFIEANIGGGGIANLSYDSGAIGEGAGRDTAEAVESYIKERVPTN